MERKVALLLEHSVRVNHRAAEKLVAAARELRPLDVAGFQHRIELLRMFDCSVQAPIAGFRTEPAAAPACLC